MSLPEPDAKLDARLRVMRLASLALLRAEGPDAESFLQGQLSSDVRKLTPAAGQLSSYSSPKGRMLAVLYLNRWGAGITLEVHRGVALETLARLRRFVMRSKLTLEDLGGQLPALGVSGEASPEALRRAGLPVPEADDGFAIADETSVSRRRGRVPRFLLRAAPQRLDAITEALQGGPTEDDGPWRRQDIEAGVPCVYPQTSDHFIAQMANLDLLNGISFDKGCFAGQEVIARLHYLGTVKRRLGLMLFDNTDVQPGMPLFEAGQPDQPVGEVADVAPYEGQRQLVSAVLQVPHLRSAGLHLASPDGPRSGPVQPSSAAQAES